MESSSVHASKTSYLASKSGSPPLNSEHMNSTPSAPLSIIGAATDIVDHIELESHCSAPGTLQGSINIVNTLELSSTDCTTRIKSLQSCASAITELVTEKIEAGKYIDAFSIQLIILAIWKQALHICHAQAASAVERSLSQETTKLKIISKVQHNPVVQESRDTANTKGLVVRSAEELAKVVVTGDFEMPDPMELIYRFALAFGRHAAVSIGFPAYE